METQTKIVWTHINERLPEPETQVLALDEFSDIHITSITEQKVWLAPTKIVFWSYYNMPK